MENTTNNLNIKTVPATTKSKAVVDPRYMSPRDIANTRMVTWLPIENITSNVNINVTSFAKVKYVKHK